MAYVPVPKDLNNVKTKVFLNLTKRQLICFGSGALLGVPLFFLLKENIATSAAAICMIVVMLPFFLLAMYENVNPSTVELTEYFGEKVSEENHFSKGSLLTDGSRSLCRLVRSIIPPSLLHRSQSSVGRVNPSQIVVINIPVNHTPHLCHGHLRRVHPVEFFFLQCRKKTLHSRIVVTSARSAHALDCSVFS